MNAKPTKTEQSLSGEKYITVIYIIERSVVPCLVKVCFIFLFLFLIQALTIHPFVGSSEIFSYETCDALCYLVPYVQF